MKETVKIKRYLNKKLNSAKKSQKKVFISRQQKSYKIKIKTPCFGNYNYWWYLGQLQINDSSHLEDLIWEITSKSKS